MGWEEVWGWGIAHPPNQTFLPPLSMLQLDQRVWPLSNGVRALVCWHGRQPMRALMSCVSGPVFVAPSLGTWTVLRS